MRTAAPSAASHGDSGTTAVRSRPDTRYRECGAMPDDQVQVSRLPSIGTTSALPDAAGSAAHPRPRRGC